MAYHGQHLGVVHRIGRHGGYALDILGKSVAIGRQMTFEAAAYILRIVEHVAYIGHLII